MALNIAKGRNEKQALRADEEGTMEALTGGDDSAISIQWAVRKRRAGSID